jgi:tetratricopeptide (TPR) repeat protein
MQRAYAGLTGNQADPGLAVVAAQLGRFLVLGGRYREGAPLLEEALELAEQLELPEVFSQALSSKAVFLTHTDRLSEASLVLKGALEVALEHGLTTAAMRAYNNLAVVFESQDRFAELVTLSEQRLELARRVGDRVWELDTLTGQLSALLALGRWEEALASAEEAKGADELASLEYAAFGLLEMTALHVHRGDLGEARLLLESMSWAGSLEDWQLRAGYAMARAGVLRAEDRPAEALAAAEEVLVARAALGLGLTNGNVKKALVYAVEAALDFGNPGRAAELLGIVKAARPGQVSPWLRAQASRLLARMFAAAGEHEGVEHGFEAAEAEFRDLGTIFDLAVSLTDHAEWLVARGRQDKAGPLRAEARGIFERLRARPWLERLGPLAGEESVSA